MTRDKTHRRWHGSHLRWSAIAYARGLRLNLLPHVAVAVYEATLKMKKREREEYEGDAVADGVVWSVVTSAVAEGSP